MLADLQGPGVISRLWTPTPTDDVLEFLFDGETKPRVEVKFRDLFLGRHPEFPRPLVGFGAGGYYCYVPLPFAKSCVVRMRAPKAQFYALWRRENPTRMGEPYTFIETDGRGHLDLAEGPNNLMFKLVGRNEQSSGLGLDLIEVVCVRTP